MFKSVNPKNNLLIRTFDPMSSAKISEITDSCYNRFRYKQALGKDFVIGRARKLDLLAKRLESHRDYYATLITREVGKPLAQSNNEISACIRHLHYYISNVERFMHDDDIKMSTGQKASILTQPLGPILGKLKNRYDLIT